jgi:hypothetical protein
MRKVILENKNANKEEQKEMNISIITLMLAMIHIESGGRPEAVGDEGKALGCLQMHAGYVADAAEFAEEEWKHHDAFDPQKSIDIFAAYMDRYATEERIGRAVTAEDIARIHNGGPDGWNKDSTLLYWHKVKGRIIELQGGAE